MALSQNKGLCLQHLQAKSWSRHRTRLSRSLTASTRWGKGGYPQFLTSQWMVGYCTLRIRKGVPEVHSIWVSSCHHGEAPFRHPLPPGCSSLHQQGDRRRCYARAIHCPLCVPWCQTNPLLTHPKQGSMDGQVIMDLSWTLPPHFSVNDSTPKASNMCDLMR